ncbi:MAG TPA: hypothetical protein VGE67_00245, partial [Haloferula sp.]
EVEFNRGLIFPDVHPHRLKREKLRRDRPIFTPAPLAKNELVVLLLNGACDPNASLDDSLPLFGGKSAGTLQGFPFVPKAIDENAHHQREWKSQQDQTKAEDPPKPFLKSQCETRHRSRSIIAPP